MRQPIISDTTKTYRVVENPWGDEPPFAGFFVEENCPVFGRSILPIDGKATYEEAKAELDAFLGISALVEINAKAAATPEEAQHRFLTDTLIG